MQFVKNNKYFNKRVVVDGITFASKKEANRWLELRLLERKGKISDLKRQVKFVLIPAQYETVELAEKYQKGVKKGQNKVKQVLLEKECSYYADFVYQENGATVVEDTKSGSFRTKEYIIKKKLMLYVHGIRINEV